MRGALLPIGCLLPRWERLSHKFGRRHQSDRTTAYSVQVGQDTLVGTSLRLPPLSRAAGGTGWGWNPVCTELDKPCAPYVTHILWAGEGLAFIRSKGDVLISSCSLLVGLELRWSKRGDIVGWYPECPSIHGEGSRGVCAQIVYGCQNDFAFIKMYARAVKQSFEYFLKIIFLIILSCAH